MGFSLNRNGHVVPSPMPTPLPLPSPTMQAPGNRYKISLKWFKIGENAFMIEQHKILTIIYRFPVGIVCYTNEEQFSYCDNGRKEQIPTIVRQNFFTRYLANGYISYHNILHVWSFIERHNNTYMYIDTLIIRIQGWLYDDLRFFKGSKLHFMDFKKQCRKLLLKKSSKIGKQENIMSLCYTAR